MAADPSSRPRDPAPSPREQTSSPRERAPRRALITGLTGQDGSFLAELLLAEGYEVSGLHRGGPDAGLGASEHLGGQVGVDLGRPARPREPARRD